MAVEAYNMAWHARNAVVLFTVMPAWSIKPVAQIQEGIVALSLASNGKM